MRKNVYLLLTFYFIYLFQYIVSTTNTAYSANTSIYVCVVLCVWWVRVWWVGVVYSPLCVGLAAGLSVCFACCFGPVGRFSATLLSLAGVFPSSRGFSIKVVFILTISLNFWLFLYLFCLGCYFVFITRVYKFGLNYQV